MTPQYFHIPSTHTTQNSFHLSLDCPALQTRKRIARRRGLPVPNITEATRANPPLPKQVCKICTRNQKL